jgi:phosphate transport system protein
MKSHFHQQLEALRMIVLQMAAKTERAMERALKALNERDEVLAQEVIDGDQEINELELEIDRLSLKLLALEQPMARDLRFIVGSIRMSIDLERIADQAVNIAQRAKFLFQRPPLEPLPALQRLADTAMDMLRVAVASFMNGNVNQARDVCQMDDDADEMNSRVLRTMIEYMIEESRTVERAVQTIIVARCLERVADQTTNIAENVIFNVDGVNIKHHCET